MIILYILLSLAVCFDVRTYRIPNLLIISGYMIGFLYQLVCVHKFEVFLLVFEAAIIFLILIPFFKIHAIGGGDVKLLSVCCMFTGFQAAISIALYSLFIGGFLSVLYLVYHRFFSKEQLNHQRHVIHFTIPILLGAVATNIWGEFL